MRTIATIVLVTLVTFGTVFGGQSVHANPIGPQFEVVGLVIVPDVLDPSSSYVQTMQDLANQVLTGALDFGTAYQDNPAVPGLITSVVGPEWVIVGGGSGVDDFWGASTNHPQAIGESGSRIHMFGSIVGDGVNQFSLVTLGFPITSNLTFEFESNDSGQVLTTSFGPLEGPTHYGPAFIGINWGPDRAFGGGDDQVIMGADGFIPVDQILFAGAGVGVEPVGSGTEQDQINNTLGYLASEAPFDFTATATFDDGISSISQSVSTMIVPEPATAMLLGLGGFMILKRRISG